MPVLIYLRKASVTIKRQESQIHGSNMCVLRSIKTGKRRVKFEITKYKRTIRQI